MASKYTHDVVATVGEYTNSQGEKKKNYQTVGKGFTDDQGRISLKMTCIPAGPEWSGWLSLFEAKPRDGQPPRQRQEPRNMSVPSNRSESQNGATPPGGADDVNQDDDIPF